MRRFAAVMLALSAALLIACSGSSSASPTMPAPTSAAWATVPGVAFSATQLRVVTAQGVRDLNVEVATTPLQRERGLGYRDALAPDAGMIFVMQQASVPSFWMKGMRFPLDIVWIGEDKRVAGIAIDVPPQRGASDTELRRYAPDVPIRYVLELNAGATARLGVATGAQFSFSLP